MPGGQLRDGWAIYATAPGGGLERKAPKRRVGADRGGRPRRVPCSVLGSLAALPVPIPGQGRPARARAWPLLASWRSAGRGGDVGGSKSACRQARLDQLLLGLRAARGTNARDALGQGGAARRFRRA